MIKDNPKKIINFKTLLRIFSAFQAIFFKSICWLLSPSIQYSILRKIISIKIVCGQAQPQNIRPNTTVNTIIKTIKVSMPIPKIKKSWGQKTIPKMMNFLSRILIIIKGSPFTFIKGSVTKIIK